MTHCKDCDIHQKFVGDLFALIDEHFNGCPTAAESIIETLALVLAFEAHRLGVPRGAVLERLQDVDNPPFAFASGIAEALSDHWLQNGPGGEA
jgi:hypothetical protein